MCTTNLCAPQFVTNQPPPLVASSDLYGMPWTLSALDLKSQDMNSRLIPTWAADALLRAVLPPGKEAKGAFVLLPAEGSDLPSLMQSR